MKKSYILAIVVLFIFTGCKKEVDSDLTIDYVGVWQGVRDYSYTGGGGVEQVTVTFAKATNSTLSAKVRYYAKGQDQVIAAGKPVIVYHYYAYTFDVASLKVDKASNAIQCFDGEVKGSYSDNRTTSPFENSMTVSLCFWKDGKNVVMKSSEKTQALRYTGTYNMSKL